MVVRNSKFLIIPSPSIRLASGSLGGGGKWGLRERLWCYPWVVCDVSLFLQQSVRLYEVWSKIKQEEKDEHYQYLKERVAIQHELIKRQDSLFKKRQAHLEQKRWQVRCYSVNFTEVSTSARPPRFQRLQESMRPLSNASRWEVCKGSGTNNYFCMNPGKALSDSPVRVQTTPEPANSESECFST